MTDHKPIENYIRRQFGSSAIEYNSAVEEFQSWAKQLGFESEQLIQDLLYDKANLDFFIQSKRDPYVQSMLYTIRQKIIDQNIKHNKSSVLEAIEYIKSYKG